MRNGTSDEDLLTRARGGDRRAETELDERLRPVLLAYIEWLLSRSDPTLELNSDDVQDTTQKSLEQTHQNPQDGIKKKLSDVADLLTGLDKVKAVADDAKTALADALTKIGPSTNGLVTRVYKSLQTPADAPHPKPTLADAPRVRAILSKDLSHLTDAIRICQQRAASPGCFYCGLRARRRSTSDYPH